MCPYVTQTTTHTSGVTGETFPIKSVITCTSKNIIYDLWCEKCRNSVAANPGSDHYVGKTQNTAAQRFGSHKSDVNMGKIFKPVSEHFIKPGHKKSDMKFLPFEVVNSNDQTLLASRESYWIQKKKTYEYGINRRK